MIKFEAPQLDVFERCHHDRVSLEFADRLAADYPHHANVLGAGILAVVAREGLRRALIRGMTTDSAAYAWSRLCLVFGCDFDEDPYLLWVSGVLNDRTLSNRDKAQCLMSNAQKYIWAVVGPDEQNSYEMMRKLRVTSLEMLPRNGARIMDFLKHIDPYKYYCLGSLMDPIVSRSARLGLTFGLTGESISIFVLLQYVLGWGFYTDPKFPWAQTIQSIPGSTRFRSKDLYEAAQSHLTSWMVELQSRPRGELCV